MDENQTMTPNEGESPDAFMQRVEESAETTKATDEAAPPPVKIGDKEYSLEELNALVEAGTRAKEIERGGREKFEEAANLRKEAEARAQEAADALVIQQAWQSGDPQARRMILQALQEEAGTSEEDSLDLEDPTPNETRLMQLLAQSQSELRNIKAMLGQVAPVLEDVKGFVDSEKGTREEQKTIAQVKEKFGVDITPERIQELKSKGITNVVAFFEESAPMLQAAVQAGADKTRKADEIPTQTINDNTFDPQAKNEDGSWKYNEIDLMRFRQEGKTPIR